MGRIIADAPDKMRHAPSRIDSRGRPKLLGIKKPRKPAGFTSLHPGQCVALDSVHRVRDNIRRYLVTCTGLQSPFAFAVGVSHLSSRNAKRVMVLDLVHLGLGTDGHTESLIPGDAAFGVFDAEVALTAPYQRRRRMTLTYPVFGRARRVLWVGTGAHKGAMLARLCKRDHSIPAGRVRRDRALLIADRASAGELDSGGSR